MLSKRPRWMSLAIDTRAFAVVNVNVNDEWIRTIELLLNILQWIW